MTTGEFAGLLGVSDQFIRNEIKAGYLQAHRIGRGRQRQYRIPWQEAKRYAGGIGADITRDAALTHGSGAMSAADKSP